MTTMHIVYFLALFGTVVVAVRYGGMAEKAAALAVTLASLATPLVQVGGFSTPQIWIGIVDFALLGMLVAIAIRSTKRWPLFAAGFHLTGVAVHFLVQRAPTINPLAYPDALALFSYPVLVAIAIGSIQHGKAQT